MKLWTPEVLWRYSAYCVPVVWSDGEPREHTIFGFDEFGIPVILNVPWNIKRDMLLTKQYIAKHTQKGCKEMTGIKSMCRILHNHKKYLDALPRR